MGGLAGTQTIQILRYFRLPLSLFSNQPIGQLLQEHTRTQQTSRHLPNIKQIFHFVSCNFELSPWYNFYFDWKLKHIPARNFTAGIEKDHFYNLEKKSGRQACSRLGLGNHFFGTFQQRHSGIRNQLTRIWTGLCIFLLLLQAVSHTEFCTWGVAGWKNGMRSSCRKGQQQQHFQKQISQEHH